jgi:hypothetical protein
MSSLKILVWSAADKRQKQVDSATSEVDFQSVRIGASNLVISESSGHFNVGAKRITNAADPVGSQDLVTKFYADSIAAGFDPKASVKVVTSANLVVTAAGSGVGKTLTADANGALVIDGVTLATGNRVLVAAQTDPVDNGIYTVAATGSAGTPYVLTRATDFDGSPSSEVTNGARTFVANGTLYGGSAWVVISNDPIAVDTDGISWTQASGQVSDATSGSGGGTKGIVTADSDKGLAILSGVLEVKHDGQGLQFVSGDLALELDGSTLSKSSSGLKVADGGITGTQLAGSVAGAGLTGGAGSALAVGAGEGIRVGADSVSVDYAESKTNDNAGAITVRQVVYVKADGDVDLAIATNTSLDKGQLGLVEDASIASAASGRITLSSGKKVTGFTGLTPGELVFVSRDTAGALTQSLTGFVAGDILYSVGRALSSTVLLFNPGEICFEY